MRRLSLLPMLMLAVLAGCAHPVHAEPAAPPAAAETEPSPSESAPPDDSPAPPPAAAPAVDSEIDALLDRVEAAAKEIRTLTTPLRYDREQGLLGDKQRRFGDLAYDAGPPARFDARFDRLIVDGQGRKIDLRFTFDGVWLAERDGDDKTFTRRQLVEEDKATEERQAMELGSSPFILPLDARKADILSRFKVERIDPADDDPKGTDTTHLKLTPLPHVRIDQEQIDLWYDQQTMLPRRVRTVDRSKNISVIDLTKVEMNKKLKDTRFDTSPPTGGGWDVQVVPLEEEQ